MITSASLFAAYGGTKLSIVGCRNVHAKHKNEPADGQRYMYFYVEGATLLDPTLWISCVRRFLVVYSGTLPTPEEVVTLLSPAYAELARIIRVPAANDPRTPVQSYRVPTS